MKIPHLAFLFLAATCSFSAPTGRLSKLLSKMRNSFTSIARVPSPTLMYARTSKATDSDFSLDTRIHEKLQIDPMPTFTPLTFKRLTANFLKDVKQIIGDPDSSVRESSNKINTARVAIQRIEDALRFHVGEIERDFHASSNANSINAYIRSTYIATLTTHAQSFIIHLASLAIQDTTALDLAIDLTSVAYVNWRNIKDLIEDFREEMAEIRDHKLFAKREKTIGDVMEIFVAYGEEFMDASRRYVQGMLVGDADEHNLRSMKRMNAMWGKLSKKVTELIMA